MLSTWIQSKKDEEGFTLIELLVVVIIIGILAAIAIPVFLNQRENAWRGAAESDARNAAIEVESYLTQNGVYPANLVAGPVPAAGPAANTAYYTQSTNVTLGYSLAAPGNTTYAITGTHAQLPAGIDACYRSAAGGLQKPFATGGTCTP